MEFDGNRNRRTGVKSRDQYRLSVCRFGADDGDGFPSVAGSTVTVIVERLRRRHEPGWIGDLHHQARSVKIAWHLAVAGHSRRIVVHEAAPIDIRDDLSTGPISERIVFAYEVHSGEYLQRDDR